MGDARHETVRFLLLSDFRAEMRGYFDLADTDLASTSSVGLTLFAAAAAPPSPSCTGTFSAPPSATGAAAGLGQGQAGGLTSRMESAHSRLPGSRAPPPPARLAAAERRGGGPRSAVAGGMSGDGRRGAEAAARCAARASALALVRRVNGAEVRGVLRPLRPLPVLSDRRSSGDCDRGCCARAPAAGLGLEAPRGSSSPLVLPRSRGDSPAVAEHPASSMDSS